MAGRSVLDNFCMSSIREMELRVPPIPKRALSVLAYAILRT